MAPRLRQRAAAKQVAVPAIDEDSMDVDDDYDHDDNQQSQQQQQPQVRLRTSDGKRFTLTKSEASCFNALHMMIEGFQNEPTGHGEYISLPSVHSDLLSKVIEWCRQHCNICQTKSQQAIDSTSSSANGGVRRDPRVELTEAHKSFLNSMREEELFELMHVTNYLDVRCLFNACCELVGKRWEGMKVADIRRLYGIESDYSTEEENQMLKESKQFGLND